MSDEQNINTPPQDDSQDVEGHIVRERSGDSGEFRFGPDNLVRRDDTPDSDDDVEGHIFMRGDGTVEEKDSRLL